MNTLTRWKTIGLVATLFIICSVPLYLMRVKSLQSSPSLPDGHVPSEFVGSSKCGECHRPEYERWKGSHHDLAMDEAGESTVLGDFDNAVFEYFGTSTRFYRRNDEYRVHTQGPDGSMSDYEIRYVFGAYPLQQYLIPFPGGRLQCLPIAWDVREKKWYHLYPDDPVDPADWLYWTNAGQNWNGMCAECHSTNLNKNYDPETDTYKTTWSEIDVSCEACHGPGSHHVAWAELPAMARPQTHSNFELSVKTSGIGAREQVELCAPCHSRRAILGDYTHYEKDLLDSLLPTLLDEGVYFPDGQILEEVYVYGSFTQSKMYHREVRCSDCHDVHSIKTVKKGNALCLQCHKAAVYDTKAHHFHKQAGESGDPINSRDGNVLFDVGTGAQCVQCHMPGRTYMGIDYRPDHSFRIPRPDLSIPLDTPNACNRCHWDKTIQWADETMSKWHGPGRADHYGAILVSGRRAEHEAEEVLRKLALDPLYPVIVRSSAISLLQSYPGPETLRLLKMLLLDEEALIRRTALNSLQINDPVELVRLTGPMLYDPVKAVRIEAANKLAGELSKQLEPEQRTVFSTVLKEFEDAMLYSADFASSRHNLGNLYSRLNQIGKAMEQYEAAISIDDRFYPAKVNLAMLYNRIGETAQTEKLLREVIGGYPEVYEIAYSLGLLLVEKGQYEEAAVYLFRAAEGLPRNERIQYNLGLLLQHLKRDDEAESYLLKAYHLDNFHFDYLYALADFYIKRNRPEAAKPFAEKIAAEYPDQRVGRDLLKYINKKLGSE